MPLSFSARPRSVLAARVVVLVALLVALTSIGVGFAADDYGFLDALESGLRPGFDLFRFGSGRVSENLQLIDAGAYPWWMAPDFKLHFVRPLSSLLFTLEHAAFGDRPLGYHLVSIGLYLALLVTVSKILRRVLPGATASLAVLVYALRSAHVLPYAWLCAQHMLVGVTPATLGLFAYIRAEREEWKPGRFLAPLLFLVGVAGSETALAIVPLWVAFAAARARLAHDWRVAARECVPMALFVALYLAVYHRLGGGTKSAMDYIDPLSRPIAFARAVATRVPMLLGDALVGFPANPRSMHLVHAAIGAAGALVCAALYFTSRNVVPRERSALLWLVPGALGAVLLGGASGAPRLLLMPDIGFAAVVGVLLRHGFERAASGPESKGWTLGRVLRVTATAGLVVAHLGVAPLRAIGQTRSLAAGAREDEAIAATAEIASAGQHVLVVASPDPDVFFYPKEILAVRQPGLVRCWSPLSAAAGAHRFTRTGERSFVLEVLPAQGGGRAADGYSEQYFAPRRFVEGDRVKQCGATIRIDAVDGRTLKRISVEMDEPLESGDVTFLTWSEGRLRRFVPPGVGDAVDVAGVPAGGTGRLAKILAGFSKMLGR